MGKEGLYLEKATCHPLLLIPSCTPHLAVILGLSCFLSWPFSGELYLENKNKGL